MGDKTIMKRITITALMFMALFVNAGEIFVNINNQSKSVPKKIGSSFNVTPENSWELLHSLGWRRSTTPIEPLEGYERLDPVIYIQDTNDVDRAVATYTDTLIQDRLDAQAAELAQRIAEQQTADLANNAELYTYQNAFLLVCDTLRGDATHTKMSFEDITVALLTIKATNKDQYETLRDALNLINSKLILKNISWWDTCVWKDDETIINQAQALYNMIGG